MGESSVKPQTSRLPQIRTLLAILILFTSPCALCGIVSLLDMAGAIPFDFFEGEVRLENRSGETLYVTPITTTYGEPMPIMQSALRQRDIPVEAGGSVTLTYDAADSPLAGIVVCRDGGECRMFETTYADVQYIDSFESLPDVEADWLAAARTQVQFSPTVVIFPLFILIPIALFAIWLYLGRIQRKQNTQELAQ